MNEKPIVWSLWDAWDCNLRYFWDYHDALKEAVAMVHENYGEGFWDEYENILFMQNTLVDGINGEVIVIEPIEIE